MRASFQVALFGLFFSSALYAGHISHGHCEDSFSAPQMPFPLSSQTSQVNLPQENLGLHNNHPARVQYGESIGRVYFHYTKKFGNGDFDSLIAVLPNLKAHGFTTIWISPVHPQTTMEMRGTPNDHYYWWSNPAKVASELGGKTGLQRLISAAKALGLEICLDVVVDHAGYADEIHMYYKDRDGRVVNKKIRTDDRRYFRNNLVSEEQKKQIIAESGPEYYYNNFITQAELAKVYDAVDNADDSTSVFENLSRLARYQWDPELPVFNHENPAILDWLVYSYKGFIDLGIHNFRLDAFKHIPMEFMITFINELASYAKEKGIRLKFLAEHVVTRPNYMSLNVIVNAFYRHVPDADVYFIDFPKALELQRLDNDIKFGLDDLSRSLSYRQDPANGFLLHRMVGDVENHDEFLPPIKHPFNRLLAFAASELSTLQPTIVFHGGVSTKRNERARIQIDEIDLNGEVGNLLKKFSETLEPLRGDPDFARIRFTSKDYHHFISDITVEQTTIIAVLHRGPGELNQEFQLQRPMLEDSDIEVVYDSTKGKNFNVLAKGLDGLRVSLNGPGVVLLRLKVEAKFPKIQ